MTRLGVFVAVAVLIAAGGCGSTQSAADEVRAAVLDLREDIAKKRLGDACEGMTQKVHEQLGESADGQVSSCPRDLRELLTLLSEGFSDAPRIVDVAVGPRRATVTLEASDGSRIDAPFERRHGDWKLANFFGASTLASPSPESPDTFRVGRVRVPALTGAPVAAVDPRSGKPCGPVDRRRGAGGCTTAIRDADFETEVRTLFGSFRLSRCRAVGTVQVARDGAILITGFDMQGSGGEDPNRRGADAACGDVLPCWRRDGSFAPWRGRIVESDDGALRAQVRACMTTCVGRFAGRTDLHLEKDGAGWTLRFDDAPVGPGALRLGGDVRAAGSRWLHLQTPPRQTGP